MDRPFPWRTVVSVAVTSSCIFDNLRAVRRDGGARRDPMGRGVRCGLFSRAQGCVGGLGAGAVFQGEQKRKGSQRQQKRTFTGTLSASWL